MTSTTSAFINFTFYLCFRGKRDLKEKKKRRKKKEIPDDADEGIEEGDSEEGEEMEMEENLDKLKVEDLQSESSAANVGAEGGEVTMGGSAAKTIDDGIFTVTVGPQSGGASAAGGDGSSQTEEDIFMPCPRMNTLMAVKHGILYLYGGMYEDGDKQVTLADMYSLDLHKLDQWMIIIANEADKQVGWSLLMELINRWVGHC